MAITLASANEYHAGRLTKEAWEGNQEEKRLRALVAAEEVLSPFLPPGPERATEAAASAIYEQAVYMTGSDYESAINRVTSLGLGGVSMGWQRNGSLPPGVAPRAWEILTRVLHCGSAVRTGSIK